MLGNSLSPAVDDNSESSHGASERGSPSVYGSSIGDANIEELSQELQHEQNKEMKHKNKVKIQEETMHVDLIKYTKVFSLFKILYISNNRNYK